MHQQAYGFEILNHPADLSFRAWGSTLPELFVSCAEALTSVIVDLYQIEGLESVAVQVRSDDYESLLYNWLSEILYFFDREKYLFCQYGMVINKEKGGVEYLQAVVQGTKYKPEQHQIKTYVKAVTLNQLKINKTDNGYSAQIFLET